SGEVLAGKVRLKQVILLVKIPRVAASLPCRALVEFFLLVGATLGGKLGRGEERVLFIGMKPPTGRLAVSWRAPVSLASREIHHIHLEEGIIRVTLTLENQQ